MIACTQPIRDQIGSATLKELLDQLRGCLTDHNASMELVDEVLMLMGHLRAIDRKRVKGTIMQEAEMVAKNQLRENLLDFLQAIDQPEAEQPITESAVYLTPGSRPALSASQVIGREKELAYISESLGKDQRPLLLAGIGGIGKTTLAAYYASQNESKYQHIAWINYLGNTKIDWVDQINNYQALGFRPQENLSTEERFEQLVHRLNQLPGQNLMIIDNLNTDAEAKELRKHISYLPKGWKVIVTSRVQIKDFQIFSIGTLQQDAAQHLFQKHYQLKPNDQIEDLNALLEQVGYHTLVVELLAKTLQEMEHLSLADMLRRIREKGLTHLKIRAEVSVAHNREKAVQISNYLTTLYDLTNISEEEKSLLMVFSVLPAIPISFVQWCEMANVVEEEDRDEWMYWFATVSRKGWLEKTESGYPSNYFMSPVLKELFRDKMPPTFEVLAPFVYYFIDLLREDYNTNPYRTLAYLPFAENLIRHLPADNPNIANLKGWLTLVYRFKGENYRALDLQKEVIDFFTPLEADYPVNLAQAHNNLSLILFDLGDYDQAQKELQQYIRIAEDHQVQEYNPGLADHNMALIFKEKADFEEALLHQQRAIEQFLQQDPPDHKMQALAYNNLSLIYQSTSELALAEEAINKAIEIMESQFDAIHPDLALALNNKGHLQHLQGKYSEALVTLFHSLEMARELYGEVHHAIGQTLNNIAYTYKMTGDFEDAIKYQLDALKVFRATLPDNHPYIGLALSNVSLTYHSQGDIEKALEYQLEATRLREENPEVNPIELAQSYNNMGVYYMDIDNMEEAEKYNNKAHEIRIKYLQSPHPELGLSFNNLAQFYNRIGKKEKAIELQQRSIEEMNGSLHPFHPRMLLLYGNMAVLEAEEQHFEEALKYQLLATQTIEYNQSEPTAELLESCSSLSYLYIELGDLPKALENFEKGYAIAKTLLPPGHESFAAIEEAIQHLRKQIDDQ
jgi:tetratricopeptide (TPR) repeat protein